jgi:chemotaxis protein histidine kinase CheA
VTRELVEKNGGSISVESGDLDQGMRTRFRLEFPIASSLFQGAATATATAATVPATTTVVTAKPAPPLPPL